MKRMYSILIADDEEGIREMLADLLSESFSVDTIARGDKIIEKISSGLYDVLILDLQLPGMNGIDVLEKIRFLKIQIAVAVITASNDLETAVTAMKLGSYDYMVKPFDSDKLLFILKNITEKLDLETEVKELRSSIGSGFRFENIIGDSPQMQRIFSTLQKVIDTDSTILIVGESGTGKEVIARAIHHNSNRARGPFRSLDCSTIPQELIASELFGHEKGAFTGATARKVGKFEAASHGTFFLDEIGNLTLDIQVKLLRVLQEKEFERIGGNELLRVDTRIVAASNRDLKEMVKQNLFREDLYYRLNVVPIYLPPLKERIEDIPLFIDYFLGKFNQEYNRTICIEPDARHFLIEYFWPGNVRQLENVLRRMVLLSVKNIISIYDVQSTLESEDNAGRTVPTPKKQQVFLKKNVQTLDEIEERAIRDALDVCGYNISKTAERLGVSRKTIHNKLKKYSITIIKSATK